MLNFTTSIWLGGKLYVCIYTILTKPEVLRGPMDLYNIVMNRMTTLRATIVSE